MADTPFDNTVQITWDVEGVLNAIGQMYQGIHIVDDALKANAEAARAWAVSFDASIGQVHNAYLEFLADVQRGEEYMSSLQTVGGGSSRQGQQYGFSSQRPADQPASNFSAHSPYAGLSDADWQWVQSRGFLTGGNSQSGFDGLSPTVMTTGSAQMSLYGGYGAGQMNSAYAQAMAMQARAVFGNDAMQAQSGPYGLGLNYFPGKGTLPDGPPAGLASDAQSQELARAYNNRVQRSQYDAYQSDDARRQALMDRAGLGGTFDESLSGLRAGAGADWKEVLRSEAAAAAVGRSEYDAGVSTDARYKSLSDRAGLGGTFDEGIDALRASAKEDYLKGITDDTAAGRAEYDAYRESVLRVRAATKDTADETDKGSSALLRHIGYIAQAIVVWGAWQQVNQLLHTTVTEMMNVEAVSARLSFVNGTGVGGTSAQLAQAAGYGVNPTQASPGLLAGAQFGASAAQRGEAGQLAEIFGAQQYSQALTEIVQTERRASDAGLSHVSTMNYIATAYQTVPGDMKTYFDALQLGITLHNELGLTAEQTGLMLLKTSATLGQSPDQVANVLERVQLRLANEKVQQSLSSQYGISGSDPNELLKQVSAKVAADPSGSQGLMTFLTQGLGIQGPRTLLDMTTALVEFNKAATSSAAPLKNINELTAGIDKTGPQIFDRLKASTDAWLGSLEGLSKQEPVLLRLFPILQLLMGNPAGAVATGLQNLKDVGAGLATDLQSMANQNAYRKDTGLSPYTQIPNPGIAGPSTFDSSTFTQAYQDWLAKQNGTASDGGPGSYDRGADTSRYKTLPKSTDFTPPDFGGFQTLPKNFNWDRFQSDLGKYSEQLTKQVPDYVQNPQEVAFWDASKGYYRTAVADSQVIQRALQDQTDLLKQVTGVFNVPAGGEVMVPFFALQSGMVPSTYGGPGSGKANAAQAAIRGQAAGGNEKMARDLGIDPNYAGSTASQYAGMDQATRSTLDYLRAHGFSPSAQGASLAGRAASGPMDTRAQAIAEHRDTSVPTVNISMRNTVVLNSRVIYDEMLHEMQAQLSLSRRGMGGGAGSQLVVG